MLTRGKATTGILLFLVIAGVLGFFLYQNPQLIAQSQSYLPPEIKQLLPQPKPSPFEESFTPVYEETYSTPQPTEPEQYQKCDRESCLFRDVSGSAPIGYGKLRGYYTTYEAEAWGEKSTCDAFVVTSGNQTLIDHFNSLIQSGNRINRIIDGRLVLNLSFNNVEPNLSTEIKSSTLGNQIEIGVISPKQAGTEAPVCFSFLEVISAR